MVEGWIDDSEPTAFVDESLRPGPSGLYVVASVVVVDDLARARSVAAKIPPRNRRFHWKDEEDRERYAMLDVLLELDSALWVYECSCSTRQQERARAKSFVRLLWDLRQLGVMQLVIESRGVAADRKDRRTILGAIKSEVAPSDLVYEHRRGPTDSGLWLADALAGATATALMGVTQYRDRLGRTLERNSIDP